MSESIDELKIEVETNAQGASTTIRDLNTELKSLKTSLDGVDLTKLKGLGTTFDNIGNINLSNSSKELRSLDKELDSVTKSVSKNLSDNLIKQFNITNKSVQKSVESMSKKFVELNKSTIFEGSKESLEKLGDAYDKLENKVSENAHGLVEDDLKDFYEYWKSAKPIYVSDKIINDFNVDNWKDLLKDFPGKFTTDISKMGNSVDTFYQQLTELYQGLFPEDIINDSERFEKIIDVLREYKEELSDTSTVAEGFKNVQDAVGTSLGNAMEDLSKGYGNVLGTSANAKDQKDAYNQVASQPGSGFSQSTELIAELSAALKKLPSENNIGVISDQLQALSGTLAEMGDYSEAINTIYSLGEAIDSLVNTNTARISNLTESLKELQEWRNSLNGAENAADISPSDETFENLDETQDAAKKTNAVLQEMIKSTKEFSEAWDWFSIDNFSDTLSDIDNLDQSISDIEEDSINAGQAYKNMFSTESYAPTPAFNFDSIKESFAEIGERAQEAFSKILNGFSQIGSAAVSVAKSGLRLVKSALQDVGKAASSAAKGAANITKNFAKMVVEASPLGKIPDTFKKISNATDTLNSKLTRMVHLFTMMAMRSAFRSVMDELGTAFEHLAQKCDDVNVRYSALMSSMNQLAHSIAALAQPLLNIFGPALEYIIGLLNTAINYVNQFLAAITGKTYTSAKYVPSDYAGSLEDAADAADDATEAQEKLNKQLQGFNELNNMTTTEPSTSTGSSGSGLSDLGDELEDCYETLDIEQDILDFVDKIKEAWANADFTEIGAILGEKLKEALESIPWDEVQYYAWKIAHSLATLINGFIEVEGLGETIGNTIGEAINTALIFADTFLTTLHWDSLGKFIADIMNGAVDSVNWKLLGKTLGDAVAAWLETIYNIIDNFKWGKLGKRLATAINEFVDVVNEALTSYDWAKLGKKMMNGLNKMLDNINWANLGKLLANAVNALFSYIDGAISTFDFASAGKHLAEFLANAIKNTDFKTIGHAIGSLVQGAINFFKNLINDLELSDFITAVVDLFNGIFSGLELDIDGEAVVQAIEKTVQSIFKAIKGMNGIELVLGAILAFSGASLPLGIALLATGAMGIISAAAENWGEVGDKIQQVITAIEKVVGVAFMAIGAVLLFSGNIPIGLALLVTGFLNVRSGINADWDSASNKVAGVLSVIDDIVSVAFLAIGAVLLFTGAGTALGLGLIAVGAVKMAESVTENLDIIPEKIQNVIDIITGIVEAAVLVIGVILLFTGGGTALGLGLIAVGAVGLGKRIAENWDYISDQLSGVIRVLEGIVGAATLVLGVILLFTGAGIPLGLGLIAAGAATLGKAINPNWGEIFSDISEAIDGLKEKFLGWVDDMKEAAKEKIEMAVSLIKSGWTTLKGWVTDAKDTVVDCAVSLKKKVSDWASDAWETIQAGGKSLQTTVETKLAKAKEWASDAWDVIQQGGKSAIATVETKLEKAKTWVSDAWTALKQGVDGKAVIAAVQTKLEKASTWVSDAWTAISNGGKTLTTTVETALTKAKNWVSDAWTALTSGGKKEETEVSTKVTKNGSSDDTAVKAIDSDGKSLATTVSTKLEEAKNSAESAVTAVVNAGKTLYTTVEEKLTKGTWSDDAWSALQSGANSVKNTAETGVKLVKSGWDTITGWFKDKFGGLFGGSSDDESITVKIKLDKKNSDKVEDILADTHTVKIKLSDQSEKLSKVLDDEFKVKIKIKKNESDTLSDILDSTFKTTVKLSDKSEKLDSILDSEFTTKVKLKKSGWESFTDWLGGTDVDAKVSLTPTASSLWKTFKGEWDQASGTVEFSANVKDESATWWKNTQTYWSKKVGTVDKFKTNVTDEGATWWKNAQNYWSKKVGTAEKFKTDVKDERDTWWKNVKTYWKKVVGYVDDFRVKVKDDSKTWWSDVKTYWTNTSASKYLTVMVRGKMESEEDWWTAVAEKLKKAIGTIKADVKGSVYRDSDWWTNVNTSLKNCIGTVYVNVRGRVDYSYNWWQGVHDSIKNSVGTVTVSVVGSRAKGGVLQNGSWSDIPQYAGGTVNAGSLFVAGEAGAELVGHIGNRTEVLNESQLAAVMESSVLAGVASLAEYLNGIYKHMTVCANGIIGAIAVNYDTPQVVPETAAYTNEHNTFVDEYGRDMSTVIDLLGQIADNTDVEEEMQSDPNGLFTIMRKKNREYREATGKSAFA